MSKTAVITGATSGIGAAFARRLAQDGYNLVITGRRKEIIRKLADELSAKHHVKAEVVIAELSDDSDFGRLADVVKAKDDVEFLINNAGYSGYAQHFEEIDVAEHEKMVKVHQIVPMRLVSLIVPGMIKRHKGAIINLSSIAGFLPVPSISVYGATKAFVRLYTQTLYFELKDKGIKVQALCPGVTETDFGRSQYSEELRKEVMSKRVMTPEKVVDISLKSLERNKVVCIPGFTNKLLTKLMPSLPAGMYYSIGARMTPFR